MGARRSLRYLEVAFGAGAEVAVCGLVAREPTDDPDQLQAGYRGV